MAIVAVFLVAFESRADQYGPSEDNSTPLPEIGVPLFRSFSAPRPDADPFAIRRRDAEIDPAAISPLLDGKTAMLRLDFFEDATFDIQFDRFWPAETGEVRAAGRITGMDDSRCTLVLRRGMYAISLIVPGLGQFDARPLTLSRVVLREIDTTVGEGRTCGADGLPKVEEGNGSQGGSGPNPRGDSICPVLESPLAGHAADDGSTVDLMVYYTAAAEAAAGGQAQIEAEIDAAVLYTNDAFVNSGINTTIRLIRTAAIDYVEVPSAVENLDRLVAIGDGFIDFIHTERDTYGADLVSLWVGNTVDAGGVAYQPVLLHPEDDGRSGFSVIREDNALFETLAHELGHNFGCQHDRCNLSGTGFFEYSYGYRQPCPGPPPAPCAPLPCTPNKDIMCYPPGTTVPYFSNPDVLVGGLPIGGVDEHGNICNNAQSINEMAFTVANFRPSTISPLPPSRLHVDAMALPGGDGATWTSAFERLTDALGLAVRSRGAVTEIWVADGTYYPDEGTGDRRRTFRLIDGVTIFGGFAGNEASLAERDPEINIAVLSGDIGSPGDEQDNSYHVANADDRQASARLEGVVLADGNADGPGWPHTGAGGLMARCSSAAVVDCTFQSNRADFVGGALYSEEAPQSFTRCLFIDNRAQYGGAVEHFNSQPLYSLCQFNSNQAVFAGGGVHCNASSPSFVECAFTTNFTTDEFGFGGALRAFNGSLPVLTGCTLAGNQSYVAGAVEVDGAGIDIADTVFALNSADFTGAMELFDAQATISNCQFDSNMSGAEAGFGQGGALTLTSESSAEIAGTEFVGNEAGFGGGAVGVFAGSTATMEACTLRDNAAWYGGGIWSDDADVVVANTRFLRNEGAFGGGGAHSSFAGTHAYLNCVFTGNRSPEGAGGGLWNYDGADAQLVNCTLAGNTAGFGPGGVYMSDAIGEIRQSILWDNAGPGNTEAQQLELFDSTTAIAYSSVAGWSGGLGGVFNDGINPMLVDPDGTDDVFGTPDDDVHLAVGSPAIDSGDPAYDPVEAAAQDIDGEPRVQGCHVDRGADEAAGPEPHTGDVDLSGTTTTDDIPVFVEALLQGSDAAVACIADMNEDGELDGADVQGFVDALLAP